MSNNIVEELPSQKSGEQPKGPMGDAAAGIEKKARQLVYDSRYQVRKETKGKKIDPVLMNRMVLERIAKSTSIPAVKTRAKQMLNVRENYIGDVKDFASNNVATALYRVFVEGNQTKIDERYLQELKDEQETIGKERKYKIRVTDKKTGTSYVRYATREKISELRANPNIQSVEMTEYGEPREGERKRGEETARATGGGERAKKDYDGDGEVESPAKEYRGAIHNAIQRKRGLKPDGQDTSSVKEEFLSDGNESTISQNSKKVTGKNVDNYSSGVVTVSPNDETTSASPTPKSVYAHTEYEGETISEGGYAKFLEMLQEKKMTKAAKKKEKKLKAKYDPSGMKASMKKQYGEKKGEEVYFATIRKQAVKEESDCENENGKDSEDDPRSMKTKVNLVKNKLRAMGLKMSYEPEGEMTESRYYRGGRGPDRNALGGSDRNGGINRYMGSPTPEQEAEERRRADAAAARAKARLRASLARERRNQGG